MKRLIIACTFILLLSGFKFGAGDCSSLVFFKEGTTITSTSYNDDGKVTGSTKSLYSKVSKTASGASVLVLQENFDKKGKPSTKSEFTIKCDKGTLFFDMKMMMPQQQAESYKDMEMTVEGADMEIPSELTVGSTLKDADIKFRFTTKTGMAMPMMNMNVKITDRKIEAKETITTPAGSFECYKISETTEMKTMFSVKAKTINWFSKEVGNVKTESYKENGKYVGKTELTEIKKP